MNVGIYRLASLCRLNRQINDEVMESACREPRSTILFFVDKEPLRSQLIDVFNRQPTSFITGMIVRVDMMRELYVHDIAGLTMLFFHFLTTSPNYRAITTMTLRVPRAKKRLDEFKDDLCLSKTLSITVNLDRGTPELYCDGPGAAVLYELVMEAMTLYETQDSNILRPMHTKHKCQLPNSATNTSYPFDFTAGRFDALS